MSSLLRKDWFVATLLAMFAGFLSGLLWFVRGSPDWFKDRKITEFYAFKARKLVVAQLVLFAMVGLVVVSVLALGNISLLALGLLATTLVIGYIVCIKSVGTAAAIKVPSADSAVTMLSGFERDDDIGLRKTGVSVTIISLGARRRIERIGRYVQGGSAHANSLVPRLAQFILMAGGSLLLTTGVSYAGDAGLASESSSATTLFVIAIAGVVSFLLALLVSIRFARS